MHAKPVVLVFNTFDKECTMAMVCYMRFLPSLNTLLGSIGISTSSRRSGLQNIGEKKLNLTSQPWAHPTSTSILSTRILMSKSSQQA